MNLGLNSFWSDNNTTSASTTTTQPTNTALMSNNNLQLTQQQQQRRLSNKLDDTELDISDIVDKILPYADDSGIKLD